MLDAYPTYDPQSDPAPQLDAARIPAASSNMPTSPNRRPICRPIGSWLSASPK